MQTFVAQNDVALQYRDVRLRDGRPLIVGYLQKDEPDNAQPLPEGGWGPPVPTQEIMDVYRLYKRNDPTRPVWPNLGQTIHTVASLDMSWTSTILQPGESYSYTFAAPGSYPIWCTIHPEMVGTVTVQ